MGLNITEKIIRKHLIHKEKDLSPGREVEIVIDQILTQDATGALAYLEFESLGVRRIKVSLAVSYVDHNTLQTRVEDSDSHQYLRYVANKYGIIFSPAGNGICHQLHLENFGRPGSTLLGADSHTPTAGALCMLSFGAGGLDVACCLAGVPYRFTMPEVVNVRLEGRLQPWVSPKDIALELLRRYTVSGGIGKIFEYTGSGVEFISVPGRATISNMGTELGLFSSIFPSDNTTKSFLHFCNREKCYQEILPDKDAAYSDTIKIDLSNIVPLIACPHSPDKVKKVTEIDGMKIDQVCIGSCSNSSYMDMALVGKILYRRKVHPTVELVISPGSSQVISLLARNGLLENMIHAGARVLECTCGPCIGLGCVPCSNGVSLRTYNRNFKGRSGTEDSQVYLCSPEVAIVSAITGYITDPQKFMKWKPKITVPRTLPTNTNFVYPESKTTDSKEIKKVFSNIKPLPEFLALPSEFCAEVVLRLGDNISTDDILPAGDKTLHLRANIPAISEFAFARIEKDFVSRVKQLNISGCIVAGENYGQGSSREHAAIVLRYLGIRVVIAKSFARIHRNNLINFGIIPLEFMSHSDYTALSLGDKIEFNDITFSKEIIKATIVTCNYELNLRGKFTALEKEILKVGGKLNFVKGYKKETLTL